LPAGFAEKLHSIMPTVCGDLEYYPCAVKLKNDQVLVCLYLVREKPELKIWGVYPEDDRSKSWIHIADVKAIAQGSPPASGKVRYSG
jgi:hypothetical protein